jgi:uncharacterized protein (TIGR03435 family)
MDRSWSAVVVAVSLATLEAQTEPTPHPQFEVASVKRNHSAENGETIRMLPGGRFEVQNMTLRILIQSAYRVTNFQISGGPGWMDSDRFDIQAKSDADQPPDTLLLMLRTLLEDRFALKAHRETRQEGAYLLTIAKGGSKMQNAEGTCTPRDPTHLPLQPQPGQPAPNYCGSMRTSSQTLDGFGVPLADASASPLSSLSGQLSRILGRAVNDQTGLTGIFNFHLRWTPEKDPSTPITASPTLPDAAAPSIFTALQEQLGLKLEPRKGPVELLIVDHAEKPDAN